MLKQVITFFWLLVLVACSQPAAPDRQLSSAQPENLDADTTAAQPQESEQKTVTLLDSSAFVWQDGYRVLPWSILDDMELEWIYEDTLGQEVPYPIFNDQVLALDGQPIQVSGYAIPLEETGAETFVILSAYPYSQCFFCGGAGPGSVIDILPESSLPRLSFDEKTTFRGKLRLNDDDLQYLNYILDDAELVE